MLRREAWHFIHAEARAVDATIFFFRPDADQLRLARLAVCRYRGIHSGEAMIYELSPARRRTARAPAARLTDAVPMGGWLKTTVGMLLVRCSSGLLLNRRSEGGDRRRRRLVLTAPVLSPTA